MKSLVLKVFFGVAVSAIPVVPGVAVAKPEAKPEATKLFAAKPEAKPEAG